MSKSTLATRPDHGHHAQCPTNHLTDHHEEVFILTSDVTAVIVSDISPVTVPTLVTDAVVVIILPEEVVRTPAQVPDLIRDLEAEAGLEAENHQGQEVAVILAPREIDPDLSLAVEAGKSPGLGLEVLKTNAAVLDVVENGQTVGGKVEVQNEKDQDEAEVVVPGAVKARKEDQETVEVAVGVEAMKEDRNEAGAEVDGVEARVEVGARTEDRDRIEVAVEV